MTTSRNDRLPRVVRVQGTLYSGRVRFATSEGLDHLADFFLREVLPEERRIDVLMNGFGLSPLVVQDILGDLLRQGYAYLDLERGEVRPAGEPGRHRRTYRVGDVVKVWQDLLTGRFLPEKLVARLRARPGTTFVGRLAWESDATPPVDFLEAPNTRIIESLNSADPGFLASATPGWYADALLDRERIGPFDLGVEVVTATIRSGDADQKNDMIEYLQADRLPRSLKLAWSRTYQRGTVRPATELGVSVAYARARTPPTGFLR